MKYVLFLALMTLGQQAFAGLNFYVCNTAQGVLTVDFASKTVGIGPLTYPTSNINNLSFRDQSNGNWVWSYGFSANGKFYVGRAPIASGKPEWRSYVYGMADAINSRRSGWKKFWRTDEINFSYFPLTLNVTSSSGEVTRLTDCVYVFEPGGF